MREEAPVYNKAGSPWRGGVKDDGTGFYVEPKPPREKERADVTPTVNIRMPHRMWMTHGRVCTRLGRDRTEDLIGHIRKQITQHGDAADLTDLAAAENELRERRSRKGGRPRGSGSTDTAES